MADAYMYRGICWYYIGSLDLAAATSSKPPPWAAAFSDPASSSGSASRYHKQGDYREAIESYSEAIAKAPEFRPGPRQQGPGLHGPREYNKAIESFNNAIRAEPSVRRALLQRGLRLREAQRVREGRALPEPRPAEENPQPKMYS